MLERPVLVFGNGIKLAGAQKIAREFAAETGIPVCPTWGALDVFPGCIGAFGTHGVPAANFAVQNADYILCIGARLDTKSTGYPVSSFAPHAKLFMVDVDQPEMSKMEKLGRPVDWVKSDAKEFLLGGSLAMADFRPWLKVLESKRAEPHGQPYDLVREIGKHLGSGDVIVSDTGNTLAWFMQGYPFKGEEFVHAFNQTPMGYGLPSSVGVAFARPGKRIVCATGDGGLSVNIGELATIARHNLPIKVILFNNRGHGMCRVTQRQWLGGVYPATSYEGGLACPNFKAVAAGYDIPVRETISDLFAHDGPGFLELKIEDSGLAYQVKFGEPL